MRGGPGPRLGLLSISALRPGIPGASFLGGQGTGGLWPQSGGGGPWTGSASAFSSPSHLRWQKSKEQTQGPVPPLATSSTPMSLPCTSSAAPLSRDGGGGQVGTVTGVWTWGWWEGSCSAQGLSRRPPLSSSSLLLPSLLMPLSHVSCFLLGPPSCLARPRLHLGTLRGTVYLLLLLAFLVQVKGCSAQWSALTLNAGGGSVRLYGYVLELLSDYHRK